MSDVTPKIRLARNLRAAREAAGLSQSEAAQRLGRTRQTLSAWEREVEGAAKPGERELAAVAALYGTDVRTLRYGEPAVGGAGPADVGREPSSELRAWFYRFAGELAEVGATEGEISAARALLTSAAAVQFYGDARRAMQSLAKAVRAELVTRHGATHHSQVLTREPEHPLELPTTRAAPGASTRRAGGAARKAE